MDSELTTTNLSTPILTRICYIIFLIAALGILCTTKVQVEEGRVERFSLWKSLNHHEASARAIRCLFEACLLLLGCSFSLYVWKHTTGEKTVEELFFFAEGEYQGASLEDYAALLTNKSYYGNSTQEIEFSPFKDENTLDLSPRGFRDTESEDISDEAPFSSGLPSELLNPVINQKATAEAAEYSTPSRIQRSSTMVPSPQAVVGAALDLFTQTLIALFFFALAKLQSFSPDMESWLTRTATTVAPLLPKVFFAYVLTNLILSRRMIWRVLWVTVAAPFYPITFRDGFVGDVLTSSVRPMQDVCYALVSIIYGILSFLTPSSLESGRHDYSSPKYPWGERSWVLHTILLPLCAIAPLWFRLLQTLRQATDSKQRWPYLGNSLKYFLAAQVAITGVYLPEWHGNPIWLLAFVVATLYQIGWDVFMDWGLLEKTDGIWQLRKERLYRSTQTYWSIALINVILRFCWTLSFLPTEYLLPPTMVGDVVLVEKQIKHVKSWIISPIIASAELIRRTLWGLLRYEYEVIKIRGDNLNAAGENIELVPLEETIGFVADVKLGSMDMRREGITRPWWHGLSDMSKMSGAQVLGEVFVYAGTFLVLWMLVAAHRETL